MAAAYRQLIKTLDKVVPSQFQPFWNHPAGPKTIFFWAPTFKWALVIAGISDMQRPVESLSVAQSTSLMFTGLIWARYSTVIIPVNWNLFSVNVFVFLTQAFQLSRIYMYQRRLKK
uniref:Mitochondrial pyruvate carrier n=1 Tax=Scolopendra viridis TaxID=118503 RepID=A0A4D5RA41_SCOVI